MRFAVCAQDDVTRTLDWALTTDPDTVLNKLNEPPKPKPASSMGDTHINYGGLVSLIFVLYCNAMHWLLTLCGLFRFRWWFGSGPWYVLRALWYALP